MPVVACPKCKTKFKLSTDQLGKAVRCNSCQAKFRTPAPEAVKAKTKKKAKAGDASKKSAAKPAAKKTPKTLEDELFSSAPLKPGAPDPLGNFVLEDPGFGELELPDPEDDGGGDSDDNMFADRQHLMNNPALKGRNPYASPTGSGSKGGKQNKKLRKELLKHEGEIKSLAWLYIVTGILGVLASLALFVIAMMASEDSTILPFEASVFIVIMGVVVLFFSALQGVLGWFLAQLQGWAKICTTILLVINLLGFPLGTIASGYFLWVLHGEKGKKVFSQEYRQAVAATPDLSAPLTTLYIMLGFGIGAPIGYAVVKMIMG